MGGLGHWPQEAVSTDKGWSRSAWDPAGLPSGEASLAESWRNRGQRTGPAKTQGQVWPENGKGCEAEPSTESEGSEAERETGRF